MRRRRIVYLLILLVFLFFLGIVVSFGLQTDSGLRLIPWLQPDTSSKSRIQPGPEQFFSVQERFRPGPDKTQPPSQQTIPDPATGQAEGNKTTTATGPEQPDQKTTPPDPESPKDGVVHTEEAVSEPAGEEDQETISDPVQPRFYIQAGACREEISAKDLAEELREKGYQAAVFPDRHADGSLWFKVRVGGYATQNEAEQGLSSYQKTINQNAFLIRHK